MTGPGPRPPRGRHAAPDDEPRSEEPGPGGRHAAVDPLERRHAAPEPTGLSEPPRRRRHAAPDDSPNGPNGFAYHRPTLGNGVTYRRPDPGSNGRTPPAGYTPPGIDDHGSPDGAGTTGNHRAEPIPGGYAAPGATGAEPTAGGPGDLGFGYHRPEPGGHRYGDAEAARGPWPETNGYHLGSPAPPAVNGYRLDEPVAPVTGFPYTAAPAPGRPTPTGPAWTAYPVNGHGVDAAERDAASWPASGNAVRPIDAYRTGLDRPLDPWIAATPLADEPTEVLNRPPLQPALNRPPPQPAIAQPEPPHPPRAVVRRRRARRKALEWPFLILFAVISAFLIRQYVVQTFYIPSASMHETLVEGDRVLVNKVGYHLHDIHRGDVVVFRKPPNLNVDENDLIKRVIGLPGETVEGRDGKVYINGAALQEPYVEPLCHGTGEFPKVTVPAGKLWVMGDNRCNSSDSRVFGPIDQHLVVGRAFVLAWPFDRVAWL